MNALVWNVQGLGNDWTFRILHSYVQQYSPSLVFLSETLSSKHYLERLRVKLGYAGMLTWEKEGRSGGLCLLWSDSISVQLLSGSKGHIDVMISSHENFAWRFTGLYGNPDASLRTHFWSLMKRLGNLYSLPWLCGGDLNEILFDHEKQGGGPKARYLSRNFKETLDHCGLADLGLVHNSHGVEEKILTLFKKELLRDGDKSTFGEGWKRGRFHFEEAWVDEAECGHIIKESWLESQAENLDGVAGKLHFCAAELEKWNIESF